MSDGPVTVSLSPNAHKAGVMDAHRQRSAKPAKSVAYRDPFKGVPGVQRPLRHTRHFFVLCFCFLGGPHLAAQRWRS